jgi:hypothetical protein
MLFRKIITVYSECSIKPKNTPSWQNTEIYYVKAGRTNCNLCAVKGKCVEQKHGHIRRQTADTSKLMAAGGIYFTYRRKNQRRENKGLEIKGNLDTNTLEYK